MKNDDFPLLFRAADQDSARVQWLFFFNLALFNFALIIISILLAIEDQSIHFVVALVLFFMIAIFIAAIMYFMQFEAKWYNSRALAESVKTVTWRYMMRADPFNRDDVLDKRLLFAIFLDFAKQNQAALSSAQIVSENVDSVTPVMKSVRASDPEQRLRFYLEFRVGDQLKWYRQKSKRHSITNNCVLFLLSAILLIILTIALFRLTDQEVSRIPLEVGIVICSAIMTWMQAKRYRELAESYTVAYHDISLVRENVPECVSEESLSLYVKNAENAFSREHTKWEARKDAT